jgi:hypothetical protein
VRGLQEKRKEGDPITGAKEHTVLHFRGSGAWLCSLRGSARTAVLFSAIGYKHALDKWGRDARIGK